MTIYYIIIPTALRSVSDGGGGGDFRFLATTPKKIQLKLTPRNLKPHIFTGCHGTQHARSSSGHPRGSWKTVAQEEILFLRV